jgi:protein gp37
MTKTFISWATYTHQFWRGCTKVSEGCRYCYMHRILEKNDRDPSLIRRSTDAEFYSPKAYKEGQIIFVNSLSDFFHKDADPWRQEAWKVIKYCPQHAWLILTKRPERIIECLPPDWVGNYSNVMLGVSIESQKYVDRMITLSEVPDAKRFISAEPLIGPVHLCFRDEFGNRPIDSFRWCIIGGESGDEQGPHGYRKCDLQWIELLVAELEGSAPHIHIHVKQLGTWLQKSMKLRSLHGSDPEEFPFHLRKRARPKVPGQNSMSVS